MSFLDKAKDLMHRLDDTAGDKTEDRGDDTAGNGDPTATTGPGVAEGGPADEQQLE